MSSTELQIANLIGIENPIVIEYIFNIYSQCNTLNEFIDNIEQLDVGLSNETIRSVYKVISQKHMREVSSRKDMVQNILKKHIGLDDQVVVNFISDICFKSENVSEFKSKLEKMDSGLEIALVSEIYKLLKPSSSLEENNESNQELNTLSPSDRDFKWNEQIEFDFSKKNLDSAPILGKIYPAKVKRIVPFGSFVTLFGIQEKNCDGLIHISELCSQRISSPDEVISIGQKIFVKVIRIQQNGKISLSMKCVDQSNGKEIHMLRGRSMDKQKIKRRLTSPERWEIRQLISSGVASIEDYPEIQDQKQESKQRIKEEEYIDIELKTDDGPKFLCKQVNYHNRYDIPEVIKVPEGSLNQTALNGSQMMKEYIATKAKKKQELEKALRKTKCINDPSDNIVDNIECKNEQLHPTLWEQNRSKEDLSYGKMTDFSIKQQRESLPIFKMRDSLIDTIKNNKFLVIVGETGSGKTTQITQYLYEDGIHGNGIIGCTQPRRVAAISVAKRVSDEIHCKIGETVGYTIRFEDETSDQTIIKYMTDGILQREVLLDPLLSKYSIVMLDEAHERTIATDVLFALLKKAASKRDDLKIIVTSATLDSEKFSKYFSDCPIIKIPGKTFPVEILYSKTPQMDYIESSLDIVMDIHINEGPGDILVFLTGQDEIDTCCEILYERVKALTNTISELVILPIYSALPSDIQSKIFQKTSEGSRKVIFATNIAETSITIDGIFFVVDPGFAKINIYNPKIGMEQLMVTPISQAQANQRKGRAGRTGPGKCFRLYTETAFLNEMQPNAIPEIQRQNLAYTVLLLKSMGIKDLLNFEFMDPPSKSSLIGALEELYNLQALDENGNLTVMGKRMSQFPMEPGLSKSLISSIQHNCSDEMLTIISMLSTQNVFFRPKDKRQEADHRKARFHHPYGDHLTLLNVYKRWQENHYSKTFCRDNYLHERQLKYAKNIKTQLISIFKKMNLEISTCHGDINLIRRALVSGFFKNAAKRDYNLGYKTINDGTGVNIHPSSSLFGKEYEYVIYHSLILTTKEYMSNVTTVDPKWLIEYAPHYYKKTEQDSDNKKQAKISPLYNKFFKDQDSWRLSSIRKNKEKLLGIKR